MNKKGIEISGKILLVVFVLAWIYYGFYRKKQLDNNHAIDIAYIDDYSVGGIGNAGGLSINFKMLIKGKQYYSSTVYSTGKISPRDFEDHFMNKTFPCIYNIKDPTIELLLIFPEDFKRFGYSFPDSLKWVLQYKK